MADSNQSELLAKFSNITGVDAERARFYLESAAWQLDMALGSFYEDDEGGQDPEREDSPPTPVVNPGPPARPAPRAQQQSRFGTISGLHAGEEQDSDEEEGQAFYAGGSEHGGGQQVLGPPRKKKNADDLVKDMFKSAKDHGAEEVSADAGNKPARSSAFIGTGYRLGESTEAPSEAVAGARAAAQPKQIDTVLKLWKNGFSVDDGPIRDYHDAANKEFLDSIHRGEVPRELIRMAKGGEVNLNMEDHRTEDYVKPKVAMKAFTGAGHMLGSPSPNVSTPPAAASSASAPSGGSSGGASVKVDESKPTTNIQIRLSDGSRMVAKFNHSHSVGDIRNYIISVHPQFAGANFALMTTFPNKELTDDSATLENAKLLNAVIVQRMK